MMPNIQLSMRDPGRHWSARGRGFFQGHLHEVVGVGDIARDGAGEAPQPRQQARELSPDAWWACVLMMSNARQGPFLPAG